MLRMTSRDSGTGVTDLVEGKGPGDNHSEPCVYDRSIPIELVTLQLSSFQSLPIMTPSPDAGR
jgi:hypothetical protein